MDFDDLGRKGVLFIASLLGLGGASLVALGMYDNVAGGAKVKFAAVSSKPEASQRYINAKRQENRGELEESAGVVIALAGLFAATKVPPRTSSPGGP